MKIKTSELTGAALDWVVAQCIRGDIPIMPDNPINRPQSYTFRPSSDWAYGGPIIEREGISPNHYGDKWPTKWVAFYSTAHFQGKTFKGPTPLIAAMRCYVASKLGDEVEVPDEIQ